MIGMYRAGSRMYRATKRAAGKTKRLLRQAAKAVARDGDESPKTPNEGKPATTPAHTPPENNALNQTAFLKANRKFSYWLSAAAVILGWAVTCFALSGGADNRVGLFRLLALFVVFPVASLVFSVYALRAKEFQFNWLGLLLAPLQKLRLPAAHAIRATLAKVGAKGCGKHWFVYKAQIFYLVFSVVCVLTYSLILSLSYVEFVWDSVWFDAANFLPALELVALPWFFWEEAQPSLSLLECTRGRNLDGCSVGHWGPYILAALLAYNFVPRLTLLWRARYRFMRALRESHGDGQGGGGSDQGNGGDKRPPPQPQAPITHIAPPPYLLLIWDVAPDFARRFVASQWGPPQKIVEKQHIDCADLDRMGAQSVVVLMESGQFLALEEKKTCHCCPTLSTQPKPVLRGVDRRGGWVAPEQG